MAKKIDVYSSDSCSFCVLLKDWLNKNKIGFTNHDVDQEEKQKFLDKRNITGIPFMLIKDTETGVEQEVRGFNEKKLEEIFK